ncbi:MAG: hypothetical protein JWO76_1264 [Nocardioides sp.]|nr:hypothetical protein [Nocardioides sp.]
MSGEIDVVTDAMRSHAGRLDQIASHGYEGVQAGQGITASGDAFGIMCSFIGAALQPVAQAGVATTAVAVGSIGATATQVRAVAKIFDEVDEVVEGAMNRFRGF